MAHMLIPLCAGKLQLANRLVMPPMATEQTTDGSVTPALCDYYARRAAGGHIGLIITEHSFISPAGKASKGQVSIASDADIPGLRLLTDAIHAGGSKAMAQINHAGGAAKEGVTGLESISASAVARPKWERIPRAMEQADIDALIADFAAAAARAKAAGYDGVEIHSAHGYLLNQFYSPLINHRTDAYTGATLEGRIRLHLQVIAAVREAVGAEYPIALRLGACDYTEGGTTIADSVAAAKAFAAAGVDLLDISGGFCGYINPNCSEQGYFAEITQALKAAADIPVLLTGGITEGVAAEALLAEGAADLIGVGRAILKDEGWAAREMAALAHS